MDFFFFLRSCSVPILKAILLHSRLFQTPHHWLHFCAWHWPFPVARAGLDCKSIWCVVYLDTKALRPKSLACAGWQKGTGVCSHVDMSRCETLLGSWKVTTHMGRRWCWTHLSTSCGQRWRVWFLLVGCQWGHCLGLKRWGFVLQFQDKESIGR